MPRRHEVLNYHTEQQARRAMKRLLKKYPVHSDCDVKIVSSPHWMFPFRYLIQVTGRDGNHAYWSRA